MLHNTLHGRAGHPKERGSAKHKNTDALALQVLSSESLLGFFSRYGGAVCVWYKTVLCQELPQGISHYVTKTTLRAAAAAFHRRGAIRR